MGKFIDLTGQQIGRWHVMYKSDKKDSTGHFLWHCRCSCDAHTERDVDGHSLRHELSLSCGCITKEKRKEAQQKKQETDLIDVTRGAFTAKEYLGNNIWKCECNVCHNMIELPRKKFMEGKLKSCGCIDYAKPKEDLTDRTFGMWHVDSYAGHSKWNCTCECGTKSKVDTNRLINYKSLGCYKHKHNKKPKFPQWFIDELKDKSLVGKINTRDIVEFICPVHGVYKQRVGEHIRLSDNSRRCGCPKCSDNLASAGSNAENEILDFIIVNFPQLEIIRHRRKMLGGQEIDIYTPELKVGIEYNGSAFHASSNGVYDDKDIYYHRDKFLLAKSKGIHLITVFDKEYEENKELVLARIKDILDGNKQFFIPQHDIECTDNSYDYGEWIKNYGYEEISQEEPISFKYKSFVVYTCGRTVWKKKKE